MLSFTQQHNATINRTYALCGFQMRMSFFSEANTVQNRILLSSLDALIISTDLQGLNSLCDVFMYLFIYLFIIFLCQQFTNILSGLVYSLTLHENLPSLLIESKDVYQIFIGIPSSGTKILIFMYMEKNYRCLSYFLYILTFLQ